MVKTLRQRLTKAASKPQKPRGKALMSTAELMRATGYGAPHISDMKANGIIDSVTVGKWPVVATLGAIVRRLREKDAGNEDRQRKNKAEADSAELAALEAAGKLIPLDSAKLFWSEARIEVRQLIERNPRLCGAALLVKIAALKKRQPEVL